MRERSEHCPSQSKTLLLDPPNSQLGYDTVPVDNSLNGCQPDPGPWKLVVQVETLEGSEKPVGILHIEPSAVVAYEIFSGLTGRVGDPDFYSGKIHEACEA
jgi:hypothetical protein